MEREGLNRGKGRRRWGIISAWGSEWGKGGGGDGVDDDTKSDLSNTQRHVCVGTLWRLGEARGGMFV